MKKIFFIISLLYFFNISFSQTVIEMGHPGDADLILLETKDSSLADLFIYKTEYKNEANYWDYSWKFKK